MATSSPISTGNGAQARQGSEVWGWGTAYGKPEQQRARLEQVMKAGLAIAGAALLLAVGLAALRRARAGHRLQAGQVPG